MRVLVTGAGGATGSIVVRKLLERGSGTFVARALVRSEQSEKKLRESLGEELCKGLEVVNGDVTKPQSLQDAFKDVNALILVTSAMPKLDKSSLPGVIAAKIFTFGYISRKPGFFFEDGQGPPEVDYLGACSQIDAAIAAGVKHVVFVSSMAGTKPDHFLNTQMNHIVLWKRKAECYLMASGVPYTIIHPGGLLPHFGDKSPAPGGRRELLAGVDDSLMDDKTRSVVPREDVAEVCVQCVLQPAETQGRSFDLGSGPQQESEQTVSVKELMSTLGGKNCAYSAADATFQPAVVHKDRNCFCGGM